MPFGSEGVEPGIGLAMSGGGFRATLFHLGSLWRLNELGYLRQLQRVSSVSGGSITSGVLALAWNMLTWDMNDVATNFKAQVANPLRDFCARNIDEHAITEGALRPFFGSTDSLIQEYDEYLFRGHTLQDLPDAPRFIFNSTNFQTGKSFRFSKPYAGDYRLGLIPNPRFKLAQAVAASSAFPPFLSPVRRTVPDGAFQLVEGADLHGNPNFTRELFLTDGGVYDNLGLETVWNRYETILCSDAGAPLEPLLAVGTSWLDQSLRANTIITSQAVSLRRRALIWDYKKGDRTGAFWSIGSSIDRFGAPDALLVPATKIDELSRMRTRLNAFTDREQGELINWGYAVCDAAVRTFYPPPAGETTPEWPVPQFALSAAAHA